MHKVHVRLTPDAHGYPPIAVESVWARGETDANEYTLENVPFFARVATIGDVVRVTRDADGVRWFAAVVRRADVSLVRAVMFDKTALARTATDLRQLGCVVEVAAQFSLVAASVPFSVPLAAVRQYLADQQALGTLDYEEPILRHP